jgi:putative endonuclease
VKACFCYLLECADGTLYVGWTSDPARRLREHNAGRASRYTRARRPVRLVYLEAAPDRSSAMRRERALKSYSRKRKAALASEAGFLGEEPAAPRPEER